MKFIRFVIYFMLIHSNEFSSAIFRKTVKNGKFLGEYPIPSKTLAPIKIEIKKVENATLPPLIFVTILGEKLKLINNGAAVEGILDQKIAGTTVTGGPLFHDIYRFYKVRYYWASNFTGIAATVVDDQIRTPLEGVTLWYNQKYGSFEECKYHRDGMVAFVFRIRISDIVNLRYIPFANKLRQIENTGSFVFTNLLKTFIWFDNYILPSTEYLTYPGSYEDEITGKVYYCATVCVYRPLIGSISKQQFASTFLSLKNTEGGRLSNSVRPYPQNDIPVVLARGQYQFFLPIGKRIIDSP